MPLRHAAAGGGRGSGELAAGEGSEVNAKAPRRNGVGVGLLNGDVEVVQALLAKGRGQCQDEHQGHALRWAF